LRLVSVTLYSATGFDGVTIVPHDLFLRQPKTPIATYAAVEALRRQRYIGKQIAAESRDLAGARQSHLRRLGLNKLSSLEPTEPTRCY
jgi:hypothetical protein